jgi:hypothetical protein
MKNRTTFLKLVGAIALVALCLGWANIGNAGLVVLNDPIITGTPDWLADARFRNFQTAVSGDYEMMIGNSFDISGNTIINSGTITTGQLPNFAYNQAAWAQNNDFSITYDPNANAGAGSVSLRLVGSGPQAGNATGGYDVTISRAPDAVTAGPLNFIKFELWDRNTFPTFPDGITISSLDGNNLGTFTIPSSGIGNWGILDPGGSVLNDGFILQGSFDLDLTALDGGKEGDKIIFKMGNANVVPIPAAVWLLGSGIVGLAALRRRVQK